MIPDEELVQLPVFKFTPVAAPRLCRAPAATPPSAERAEPSSGPGRSTAEGARGQLVDHKCSVLQPNAGTMTAWEWAELSLSVRRHEGRWHLTAADDGDRLEVPIRFCPYCAAKL